MKKRILILVYAVILLFSINLYAQTDKLPLLKFDDLQKYDGKHQTFQIEGFVLNTHKCGKCPPKAWCKPCENGLTAVDQINDKDSSLMKQLRIATANFLPEKFLLKKKYLFTVKLRNIIAEGSPITSVELIGFKKIE